jgi:AcrR family transcriptional regulator
MTGTGGLRERKKEAAMRRIQQAALDLFDEHGFANVTIEQIAASAEVSPSSVYRYFGTKEQVVLYDDIDANLVERVELELASHPPVTAVRRAVTDLLADYFDRDDELTRRKVRYAYEEPALRAASLEMTDMFVPLVADALARVSGRGADDLEVQVIASVLIAALMAAVRHWYSTGYVTSLRSEIDHALSVAEGDLQLRGKRRSRSG